MTNLKYIPTWKIKEILNDPYCRGIDGADYEPVKEELQNILNERESKMDEQNAEKLIEFYNEEGQWQDEYCEHEDNINNYAECACEGEVYTGELDDDIKFLVEYLDDNGLIFDHSEAVYTYDFYRVSNEVASINIGEVELQLDDEKLKKLTENMTKEQVKECQDNSEYYIKDNYLYIDKSYDRVSLILNEKSLIESLKV